jgi:hypothetical protein
VSSDLSHFHGAQAREIDRERRADPRARRPARPEESGTPIDGLLLCARRRGLAPELIDLRNSGDTAGDRSRVVGYASFAFAGEPAHG